MIIMNIREFERTTSGIENLDRILRGGIVVPSLVLVLGDVGTGKSVICQQFIYKQAILGFKSVYFCIDNQPEDVVENMESLGWNVNKLVESGVLKFVNMFSSAQSFEGLIAEVLREISSCERFVFDSISSIAFLYGERNAYDLLRKVKVQCRTGGSVGVINAVKGMHTKAFEIAIQQVCCNVISLEMRSDGRFLRVLKTMKTGHDTEEFGIEIEKGKGVYLI